MWILYTDRVPLVPRRLIAKRILPQGNVDFQDRKAADGLSIRRFLRR